MRFTITSTTIYDDSMPCDGTKKQETTTKRICRCRPLYHLDKNWGWTEAHDEEGRYWWRNHVDTDWFIEVETLQDLLDLQERLGSPLILDGEHLEIYDGYRE